MDGSPTSKDDFPPREFRQIQRARVIDILDELKCLHERLSDHYGEMGDEARDQRASLLLKYLQSHEQYVRNAVEQYERDADETILQSWFRYAQNIPVDQLVERARVDPNVSPDQIAAVVADVFDFLVGALETIAITSHVPEVQEALENLRDLEQQAKVRALRSADEDMQ